MVVFWPLLMDNLFVAWLLFGQSSARLSSLRKTEKI